LHPGKRADPLSDQPGSLDPGHGGQQRAWQFHESVVAGLLAYATAQFDLNAIVSEKPEPLTKRAFLEAQAAQGDPESIRELQNLPEIPEHGAYLWAWFRDLHDTRQSNSMGPSRLSRQEIRLWEEDEGRRLAMWERKAVMALDAAWFSAISEDLAKRNNEGSKK
jgi:hypothetical protein